MRALLAAALALTALPALGQDRPSEEELFGAPAEAPPARPAKTAPAPKSAPGSARAGEVAPAKAETAPRPALEDERQSEDAMFGGADPSAVGPGATPVPAKATSSALQAAEEEREKAPDDPLKIGGQLYWRAFSNVSEGQPPSQWTFSTPTLLDTYFDARPNDRIRAFALGRVSYDPTINESDPPPSSLPGTSLKQLNVVLDQLWLRFDLERTVFVTAGRQHVKWGVGRFWNPTDYLHQVYKDPLSQFDARTGTTLVKLHVPWEREGWNFYGIGLLEDTVPGGTLGKIGAGARAEVVFGQAELGVDALVQRGHRPRFGADLSAGLGPIDVYAEAALRTSAGALQWHLADVPDTNQGLDGYCSSTSGAKEYAIQATAGLTHSFNFTDELVVTAGGEYFYNSVGSTKARDYPCMILKGQFTPFFVGVHYAGIYASWNNPSRRTAPTFTLSNLTNFSDFSHVARLDYSMVLLTHLRIEAYTAFHYGKKGGEFRLGIDLPPPLNYPFSLLELGVGLRINI